MADPWDLVPIDPLSTVTWPALIAGAARPAGIGAESQGWPANTAVLSDLLRVTNKKTGETRYYKDNAIDATKLDRELFDVVTEQSVYMRAPRKPPDPGAPGMPRKDDSWIGRGMQGLEEQARYFKEGDKYVKVRPEAVQKKIAEGYSFATWDEYHARQAQKKEQKKYGDRQIEAGVTSAANLAAFGAPRGVLSAPDLDLGDALGRGDQLDPRIAGWKAEGKSWEWIDQYLKEEREARVAIGKQMAYGYDALQRQNPEGSFVGGAFAGAVGPAATAAKMVGNSLALKTTGLLEKYGIKSIASQAAAEQTISKASAVAAELLPGVAGGIGEGAGFMAMQAPAALLSRERLGIDALWDEGKNILLGAAFGGGIAGLTGTKGALGRVGDDLAEVKARESLVEKMFSTKLGKIEADPAVKAALAQTEAAQKFAEELRANPPDPNGSLDAIRMPTKQELLQKITLEQEAAAATVGLLPRKLQHFGTPEQWLSAKQIDPEAPGLNLGERLQRRTVKDLATQGAADPNDTLQVRLPRAGFDAIRGSDDIITRLMERHGLDDPTLTDLNKRLQKALEEKQRAGAGDDTVPGGSVDEVQALKREIQIRRRDFDQHKIDMRNAQKDIPPTPQELQVATSVIRTPMNEGIEKAYRETWGWADEAYESKSQSQRIFERRREAGKNVPPLAMGARVAEFNRDAIARRAIKKGVPEAEAYADAAQSRKAKPENYLGIAEHQIESGAPMMSAQGVIYRELLEQKLPVRIENNLKMIASYEKNLLNAHDTIARAGEYFAKRIDEALERAKVQDATTPKDILLRAKQAQGTLEATGNPAAAQKLGQLIDRVDELHNMIGKIPRSKIVPEEAAPIIAKLRAGVADQIRQRESAIALSQQRLGATRKQAAMRIAEEEMQREARKAALRAEPPITSTGDMQIEYAGRYAPGEPLPAKADGILGKLAEKAGQLHRDLQRDAAWQLGSEMGGIIARYDPMKNNLSMRAKIFRLFFGNRGVDLLHIVQDSPAQVGKWKEGAASKVKKAVGGIKSAGVGVARSITRPSLSAVVGKSLLGEEDTGEDVYRAKGSSLAEKAREKGEQLLKMFANPRALMDKIDAALVPIKMTDPETGMNLKYRMLDMFEHLYDKIPRNPDPVPLFKGSDMWLPSDEQAMKFALHLAAAEDPFGRLISELEEGIPHDETIETVQTLYKDLYAQVREWVMDAYIENPKQIRFDRRLALSQIFGLEVEPVRDPAFIQGFLQVTQDMYAIEQDQQQPGGKGGYTPPKRKLQSKLSTTPTVPQRLS